MTNQKRKRGQRQWGYISLLTIVLIVSVVWIITQSLRPISVNYGGLSCSGTNEDVLILSDVRFMSAWEAVSTDVCQTIGVGMMFAPIEADNIETALLDEAAEFVPDIVIVTTDTLHSLVDQNLLAPLDYWSEYYTPPIEVEALLDKFTIEGQVYAIPINEVYGFAVNQASYNQLLAIVVLQEFVGDSLFHSSFVEAIVPHDD